MSTTTARHRPVPDRRLLRRSLRTSTSPDDPTPSARARAEILAAPGFGKYFTDHMARATWTRDDGWHDARVEPYGPIALDPSAAVLHYAQEIFEGMKAYRHADGSVWTFRPRGQRRAVRPLGPPAGAARAARGRLPGVARGAGRDRRRVGAQPAARRASTCARSCSPPRRSSGCGRRRRSRTGDRLAGGRLLPRRRKPVSIWLSQEYTARGAGGTGAAKCGGNYAASLLPQREASEQRLRPGRASSTRRAHARSRSSAG